MPQPKGHIGQIAEKYNRSAEYVRNVIRSHPELGITLKPRTTTKLTTEQINALCGILDKELGTIQIPEHRVPEIEEAAEPQANGADQHAEVLKLWRTVDELRQEVMSKTIEAEVARTQIEEQEKRIEDIKYAWDRSQHDSKLMLEAAKDERDEARNQITSLEEELESVGAELDMEKSRADELKEKLDAAYDEMNSFHKSIFGFWRKRKI
ncbi:MAG: hypothetical protein LUB61_03095 [Eggerthellaceae bacterium]|nr:hypothetical protein [Eggerthellaceae bacterium]